MTRGAKIGNYTRTYAMIFSWAKFNHFSYYISSERKRKITASWGRLAIEEKKKIKVHGYLANFRGPFHFPSARLILGKTIFAPFTARWILF